MSLLKRNYPQIYGLVFSIIAMIIMAKTSYELEIERVKISVVENLNLNHELSIASISGNLMALQEEINLLAGSDRVKYFVKSASSNTTGISALDEWGADIVAHFEYHDLLIINELGDIIYSVAKEKDLGTNLVNGPFSGSGLGKLYDQIIKTKKFSVADFSIYEPSSSKLAGFVGAPIFNGEKLIGLISIQLSASFEKLNIGVHMKHVEDYIITTNYYFDSEEEFQPIDKIGFNISKESSVIMRDSLFLYTPFQLGNLDWGILSVVSPVVFKNDIRWSQIWYHVILALLVSRILVLLVLFQYKKSKKALVYIENEAMLVQNTWHQFSKTDHSFGTDFYYRIKNKDNIELGVEHESIDNVGSLIEQNVTQIIDTLLNKGELNHNLLEVAKVCSRFHISSAQILKIPELFLESFEDEMGSEIPIRAKLAWQKILKSLSAQLIGLLKKTN